MAVFQLRTHPQPLISVIIPSRDGHAGGNVPRLLGQLLQQTRIEEAEILLVVGERPNGHARNVGVDASRGKWLVFMDDDAGLLGNDILVQLLKPLEGGTEGEAPRIGMTGSATRLPDDATSFQQKVAAALPRALFPEVDRLTETDMAHHLCCALPRQVYQEIGRESDTLETGTDVDLRHRLAAAGFSIVVVPHTVATHPQPGSLTELWRKHLWYGCGRVQLDRMHPPGGRNVIQGGRMAVVRYLSRAVLTAPLRVLRYDRSSPWTWNPLLALTDLAQKVGYARAYWRDLKGLGPRWAPLLSSRWLAEALTPESVSSCSPPDPAAVRSLLVVLTAGLGDAVTFLPVLNALRSGYPRARLTVWVGRGGAARVVRLQAAADEVICFNLESESIVGRVARKVRLLAWLRWRRFDLAVVNFINSNEETAVLLRLGGVKARLGYVDDPGRPDLFNLPVQREALEMGTVAAERHRHLLPVLGLEVSEVMAPVWSVPEAAHSRTTTLVGERPGHGVIVGFHPGSGAQMAWKRWPVERFAQLADRLAGAGAEVWIFGGTDERNLVASMQAAMQTRPRDLTGEPDLNVTAALMERCDLVVSNDSGLYNLALALSVPVVALFGPTLPGLSGPWKRIAATEVVAKEMTCRPCVDLLAPPSDLHCPIGFACLEEITVDQVEAACRRQLQPGSSPGLAALSAADLTEFQAGAGSGT
jgi:heptosyltransferase-2